MHIHSQEDWVTVSQHDLNEVESKEQRGIKLEFMFSPSDLPVAWRIGPAKGDTHVVEFKYLTDSEPKKVEHKADGVSLELGKNSKRIYKIFLDFSEITGAGELVVNFAAETIHQAQGLNQNNSEIIQRFLSSTKSKPNIVEKLRA